MTLFRTRASFFSTLLVTTLAGCGPLVSDAGSGSTGGLTEPAVDPLPSPTHAGTAYPGKGFIVHEWGTNTVVVGSDGSLQRGLHHEEEDLPGFVYDRIAAGSLDGSTSVEVKMETPVTYFYSDAPLVVKSSVDFPKGVFTQWYPAVQSFVPRIAGPNNAPGMDGFADPVLDPAYPFGSLQCKEHYSPVAGGRLDWGSVEVLARDTPSAEGDVPSAPLDLYTWSHARKVSANRVRVSAAPGAEAGQLEHFLFYRGLGNFELPVAIQAKGKNVVSLHNGHGEAIPRVFVIQVGEGKGAFSVSASPLAPGADASVEIPSLWAPRRWTPMPKRLERG
jgi:hypothetical protein